MMPFWYWMLSFPVQTAQAEGFELKEDVVPSGYTEVRGTWANVSGTAWTTQQRLRPTLKIYPADRISLRLTVEAQHNQGRHDATDFVNFVDEAVQEQLDLNLAQVEELTGCHISANPAVESVSDVVSIERFFLDFNRSSMDLRIGRQAIAWGSAIGINPTDVFSEFLLSEPWRERSGVDVARLTIAHQQHQLMLVGGADDVMDGIESDQLEWKAGFRATTHVGTTDISLIGSSSRWRVDNNRHFLGVDLKGDWHIGWWLEGGYDGDLRIALGADYSFPILQVLYVAAQLNYEGGGVAPEDRTPTLRHMEDLEICHCEYLPNGISIPVAADPEPGAPPMLTTGRLYGLLNIRWTLADDWELSGFGLWNLEDGTGIAFPYLTWFSGQRITTNLGIQAALGKDGEFKPDQTDLIIQGVDLSGLMPSRTALAWIRISI